MDMRAFAALQNHTSPETPTSSLIAIPFHEPRHANHISYLETSIGPATLVLVRQLRLRQSPESTAHKHARRGKLDSEILEELELQETWRGAADLIENAVELATGEELDDDGCDVLYGRAGLVYALLLLRSELLVTVSYLAHAGKPGDKVVRAVEALCSDENIQALVDDIIKRGELGAARYAQELEADERGKAPPLMWKWHGSRTAEVRSTVCLEGASSARGRRRTSGEARGGMYIVYLANIFCCRAERVLCWARCGRAGASAGAGVGYAVAMWWVVAVQGREASCAGWTWTPTSRPMRLRAASTGTSRGGSGSAYRGPTWISQMDSRTLRRFWGLVGAGTSILGSGWRWDVDSGTLGTGMGLWTRTLETRWDSLDTRPPILGLKSCIPCLCIRSYGASTPTSPPATLDPGSLRCPSVDVKNRNKKYQPSLSTRERRGHIALRVCTVKTARMVQKRPRSSPMKHATHKLPGSDSGRARTRPGRRHGVLALAVILLQYPPTSLPQRFRCCEASRNHQQVS